MPVDHIVVFKRKVYGNTHIYPHCMTSHILCDLVGKKTITAHMIDHILLLGLTITYISDPDL